MWSFAMTELEDMQTVTAKALPESFGIQAFGCPGTDMLESYSASDVFGCITWSAWADDR